jgi:hypothetical protein
MNAKRGAAIHDTAMRVSGRRTEKSHGIPIDRTAGSDAIGGQFER